MKLNQALLDSNFNFPSDLEVHRLPAHLPEKILQFGEGNFLRAFVDWMVHGLNKNHLFNGRIVLVQPIPDGLAEIINAQDGLYTLLLRGLENNKEVERKELISSVSRCLNPYRNWADVLACAENPELEFVISNTTEAGIVFDPQDRLDAGTPNTFPGKLTAFLYHRYRHFAGAADRGLTMIACELIDRNGDKLKEAVLSLCSAWKLPESFRQWVQEQNMFLNSLVDRVVTGYPRDEIQEITARLGYEDALVDTGELFHLWVIEGPAAVADRLPFAKLGLNVVWTDDMTPYRTRKVRILNGAHTSSVPAAFLYGLDTVGEMMDHPVMGSYVRQVIYEEIIPSIDLDRKMLVEFADAVVDRFRNPFIHHYLLSILLNSASKFKARVLPSILEHLQTRGSLPEKLCFSFAALIAVYQNGKIAGNDMNCRRERGEFVMRDEMSALKLFERAWALFDGSEASVMAVVRAVLGNRELWGQDLNEIPGLTETVGRHLASITAQGIRLTVNGLVK